MRKGFKNTWRIHGKYLKVHKIENFFGFDFEFYTDSLLVMLQYDGFVTKNFLLAHYGGR
jgi:hypothetical protein